MDRWYNKFKSNEVIISDVKPDVIARPEDAPAGAFARIQRRRWKVWAVVNNLFNATSVTNIFFRSGVKNDWIEYVPPLTPNILITAISSNTTIPPITSSIIYNCTNSVAITVTLPSASGKNGLYVKIKRSNQLVTINSAGGTIDGVPTLLLSSIKNAVELRSDGTNWLIY